MRLNHFFCKFSDTPWPVLCQVFIACLGSFSSGLVIGSTNVPFEGIELCWEFTTFYSQTETSACSPMDNSLWYFYLTAFSVTACISSFCGGSIINKYGRLQPLIYNNFFYMMGAFLTSLAAYPVMFGIGRMLSGIACGMTFLVVPIYISEISQFSSEKIFCTFHQASVALGVLISSLLGIYGSVAPFWRLTYGIVLIPAIVQTILLVNCVETPHYLLLVGQDQKAKENLGILFENPRRINNEMVNIIKLIAESNRRTNPTSEPTAQRSGTRQEKTQIDEPEAEINPSLPSSSSAPAVASVPTAAVVSSSLSSASPSSSTPSPFLNTLSIKSQVSTPPTPEVSSAAEIPSPPEASLTKATLPTSSTAGVSSSPSPSPSPSKKMLASEALKKKERLYKILLAGGQPEVSEIDEAITMLNENNIPAPKPIPRKGKERASSASTTAATATATETTTNGDLEIAEIVYTAASSSSPTNAHINSSSSSSSPDTTNTTTTPVSVSSSYPSSLLDNLYGIASTSAPVDPQFAETSINISSDRNNSSSNSNSNRNSNSNNNRNRSNNINEDANRQEISYDKIWSLSEVIADKHNRNILILATGALIFQQLVGIHIIIYYSTRIFSHVLSFDVNMGVNLSAGITVCYFYVNLFSVFLLNRFSCHRKLFLVSCGSTFVFSILFVIGYGIHVEVLAVVAVYGYVVAFTIGFGVIPPMMLVQLTTPNTVASINAFAHSMGWMMNVVMGQCLPLLMNVIGGYTFAIFAGFAVLAIPFGIIVVSALFKGGDRHYQFYLY